MIKTEDAGFMVDDELLRSCSLVALDAVRDLFICAKHLFGAVIADGDAARLQQSAAQVRSQETVAGKK